MGIKIEKPSIYLGKSKVNILKFAPKYKNAIKEKIGSKYIHLENKKNIFEMSLEACRKINLNSKKINFLIFVSQGQDKILPSCAEQIAQKLNLNKNAFVFTISSGCSGFVQALFLASELLNQKNKNGLIVCAEKYSKYIPRQNTKIKVLFSDAASATLVKYDSRKNILGSDFGYDGNNYNALQTFNFKNKNILSMDGNRIYLFGINSIPKSIKNVLKNKKIKIDYYLLHNGSKFLIDSLADKVSNSKKKLLTSFNVTGNTVSSSIPLLINIHYKKLKSKNIIMSGFGVGLSWATILMKWI